MNFNLFNNNNLLLDNNFLTYYSLFISCGLILTISFIYLTRSNGTTVPTQEALTYEEIEAIVNENANTVTTISSENIDYITDTDSDTDLATEYQSTFDSDSTSDTESILNDPDLFFMPNVDFDVCPIEELKFFEFSSLYQKEIIEHSISDAEIMEFIS
jgi:hypothetical protein